MSNELVGAFVPALRLKMQVSKNKERVKRRTTGWDVACELSDGELMSFQDSTRVNSLEANSSFPVIFLCS